MAQKTDSALLVQSAVIRTETVQNANTALRIGTMLDDVIGSKLNTLSGVTKISFNAYSGTTVTGYTSLGNTTLLGSKLGRNLRFKGLIAGSNITLTPSASGVTISSSGGGGGGGTLTGATNGISVSGTKVKLGGILTGSTVINLNTNTLSLTNGKLIVGNSMTLQSPTSNYFIGESAGNLTATGLYNTAFGAAVMPSIGAGTSNVAFGLAALQSLTTGNHNIGIGSYALNTITDSPENIGIGFHALWKMTGDEDNTAIGFGAGDEFLTGRDNVFLGYYAGSSGGAGLKYTNGDRSVFIGTVNALNAVESGQMNIQNAIFGRANSGTTILSIGKLGFYETNPTARVQIKGSGSSSNSTAFLIQNSGSTNLFKVQDDGTLSVGSTNRGLILDRVNTSTGNSITLNFNNAIQRIFKTGSASNYITSTGITVTLTGNTNALSFSWIVFVNGNINLTMPASFVMPSTEFRWNSTTKVLTLNYANKEIELGAIYDGSKWLLKATEDYV